MAITKMRTFVFQKNEAYLELKSPFLKRSRTIFNTVFDMPIKLIKQGQLAFYPSERDSPFELACQTAFHMASRQSKSAKGKKRREWPKWKGERPVGLV